MAQKHFLEVEKGEEVAAVHHEADSDRWIFFCHGFGSDKEGSYIGRCERAVEEGFNAVRFDFRGNEESDGEFIEQTLSSKMKDLEKVVEFFDPERYVVFGSSFGGKVGLHHSAKDPEVEAVVVRAPVTYNSIMERYRNVVEEKGEFEHHEGATIDQRFFEDLDRHSFDPVAGKIDPPVAIFHGAEDTTVHPENSFEAAADIRADVTLSKLKSEKHRFSEEAEQRMKDQMFKWLEAVL